MQVTVETGEGLARQMTVELPPEEIEQQIDQRLREVARNARLPGFRPGKVPLRVLRQRFGDSVRAEVFGEMIKATFSEAIAKADLRPAGIPEFEADIDQSARRYAYIAKFEVLPQIVLNSLKDQTIKRPIVEVHESDLDAMIERLRKQRMTWTQVERPAAIGDRVIISFKGTIDGEAFPGGSAENRPLELGSGLMVPGFEEQLVGAVASDERSVEVTFPSDYHAPSLAGKQALFAVSIVDVAEPVLPEIDADFIRGFGIEDGNLDAFRADVRRNMERELKQRVDSSLKNQVMDALIKANPLDLPAALVAEEVKVLKEQMRQATSGTTVELPDELFADAAKRRVALGLVIAEIVKQHDIAPVPDRVRATIEEMASSYETPQDMIDHYYADRQRLASVESLVLEEMVVERMLEDADVQDEPMTFEALTETPGAA
jgi:trigger factor